MHFADRVLLEILEGVDSNVAAIPGAPGEDSAVLAHRGGVTVACRGRDDPLFVKAIVWNRVERVDVLVVNANGELPLASAAS